MGYSDKSIIGEILVNEWSSKLPEFDNTKRVRLGLIFYKITYLTSQGVLTTTLTIGRHNLKKILFQHC